MRITGTFLLLFSLATSAAAWSGCGVSFRVPKGWSVEPSPKDRCAISISPKRWKQIEAASRYDDSPFAIQMIVRHGRFEPAAEKLQFAKNGKGEWGMPGKGDQFTANAVRLGSFRGWRSRSLLRGFAREGAVLGEQSRVWSQVWVAYLLHDAHGTIVCVQYNQWNPDIKIDRPAAANKILASLTLSSTR